MIKVDTLVIGAGPGGYSVAARCAARGEKVIVIERSELGGTCLNRGCIPTKTLCRSAEVADTVAEASQYGISASAPVIDFPAVMTRKDAVVAELRAGVAELLRGVTVIQGEAEFVSPTEVKVGDDVYTADRIVVATGSRPASVPVKGAEYTIDSDAILSLTELPTALTVIGGGVVGVEIASIFRSFGVEVNVVEALPELLPALDAEVAKRLRMSLKRRGITVYTASTVSEIHPDGSVTFVSKGKEKTLPPATVLMAVGRKPVIPKGLVEAGAQLTPRGFLKVDTEMKVQFDTPASVYAIGDVNGLCMLAHAAEAQGEIVTGYRKAMTTVPGAVFTHPECAMVGLTSQQAAADGIAVRECRATYRANGKALAMGETDGMVKIILSEGEGRILGAHICGAHASDLLAELTLAVTLGLTAEQLLESIHTHPTLSEIVTAALQA